MKKDIIDNFLELVGSNKLRAGERREVMEMNSKLLREGTNSKNLKNVEKLYNRINDSIEERAELNRVAGRERYLKRTLMENQEKALHKMKKIDDIVNELKNGTSGRSINFNKPRELDWRVEERWDLYKRGVLDREDIVEWRNKVRQFAKEKGIQEGKQELLERLFEIKEYLDQEYVTKEESLAIYHKEIDAIERVLEVITGEKFKFKYRLNKETSPYEVLDATWNSDVRTIKYRKR